MERVGSGEFSQKWRVARACARCHRLKSKCVYEDPTHESCRRCFALSIPCSVDEDPTAQSARRRPGMKLPIRTPAQILQKIERLLAEAEREFARMPRGEPGEGGLKGQESKGEEPKGEEPKGDEPRGVRVEREDLNLVGNEANDRIVNGTNSTSLGHNADFSAERPGNGNVDIGAVGLSSKRPSSSDLDNEVGGRKRIARPRTNEDLDGDSGENNGPSFPSNPSEGLDGYSKTQISENIENGNHSHGYVSNDPREFISSITQAPNSDLPKPSTSEENPRAYTSTGSESSLNKLSTEASAQTIASLSKSALRLYNTMETYRARLSHDLSHSSAANTVETSSNGSINVSSHSAQQNPAMNRSISPSMSEIPNTSALSEPGNDPQTSPLEVASTRSLGPAQDFLFSLISTKEAKVRYMYFHDRMLVHFPVLAFPSHLRDFQQALEASPLLVLACIYVTTTSDHKLSNRQENRRLNEKMMDYLDRALAQTIFIEAVDLSYHIVYACMILSIWDIPPLRAHQYKSHIELITAYSVSVCIDAGNVSSSYPTSVFADNSLERNNLRSFLAVFCSCGSFNFALPRFNFATWTPRHNLATEILSRSVHGSIPSRGDQFLSYFSRIVRVGKQISDFLTESGVSMNLLTSEEERGGIAGLAPADPRRHSLQFKRVVAELSAHEKRLYEVVDESGLLSGKASMELSPGEKYTVLLTYYHLLLVIYDNLVSWCIYNLNSEGDVPSEERYFPDQDKKLIIDYMLKFGNICEQNIDCFIELNAGGVTGYPTFLYYRTLTALVSLIRVSILVKSDVSQILFPEVYARKFRLHSLYEKLVMIIESSKVNFDSQVCERFSSLLKRIGRWVPIVACDEHQPFTSHITDYLMLTNISKGQEVEKFAAQQMSSNASTDLTPMAISSINNSDVDSDTSPEQDPISKSGIKSTSFSVQEMFKGIDEDIIRYLNPFDTLDTSFAFAFD